MSICVNISQEGVISHVDVPLHDCTAFVLVSVDEHSWLTQSVNIEPAEVLEVFGITFGWVVFLSAIAFKVRVARRSIKLA